MCCLGASLAIMCHCHIFIRIFIEYFQLVTTMNVLVLSKRNSVWFCNFEKYLLVKMLLENKEFFLN